MNLATKLLRGVVLMSTSLALTACGGAMTEEEAAALEAEALSTSSAELGSCAGWSEWYNTASSYCGTHTSCGYTWSCDYLAREGSDGLAAVGGGEQQLYYCDDGSVGYKIYNPATKTQQESYRACFDQYGGYTHTEYQHQYAMTSCGC